jgi:thioredoxin reductase (NADPH)
MTTVDTAPVVETPDLYGAFPRLSDAQIETLGAYGRRRPTRRGDILALAGHEFDEFLVVLRGRVAVLDERGADRRTIHVHGPRRFLGEIGLLEGQVSFLTFEVRDPGAVLAVPVDELRRLVLRDNGIGDLILRAYLIRRSLLISQGAGFRIIGSCYSADTRRLRDFAARNRLPHQWLDLEKDRQADHMLEQLGYGVGDTPVVIWRGGEVLRNPSNAELAARIGLLPATTQDRAAVADLLVVGAGPAGLAAAVYGSSDGLDTCLIDGVATGGQAATSARIENYLGFPTGISGAELAERAVLQAEKFGARIRVPAEATGLDGRAGHHVVALADGGEISARTVVIATGARYRRLQVPRITRLENGNVYYAATQPEALLCQGDPCAVVGGGNSAGQAALFLAGRTPKVYLLVRGGDLGKTMSRYLVDEIRQEPRIEVRCDTEVAELLGDTELEAIVVRHNRTDHRETIPARNLFVFIGATPHTAWLAGTVALDRRGFVLTGSDVPDAEAPATWARPHRRPMPLETSRPGVFAVGDVASSSVKRVAAAVGGGAMAVRLAFERLGQEGGPFGPSGAGP